MLGVRSVALALLTTAGLVIIADGCSPEDGSTSAAAQADSDGGAPDDGTQMDAARQTNLDGDGPDGSRPDGSNPDGSSPSDARSDALPPEGHPQCAALLGCIFETAPTSESYAAAQGSYGPNGTCWASATAQACEMACKETLATAAEQFPDSAKCNPTACKRQTVIDSGNTPACGTCMADHCCVKASRCLDETGSGDTCGRFTKCLHECPPAGADASASHACYDTCETTFRKGYLEFVATLNCEDENCSSACGP